MPGRRDLGRDLDPRLTPEALVPEIPTADAHAPGPSGREGWSSPAGSADPASLIDELARTGQAMLAEIAAPLGPPAQARYDAGVDRLRWARQAAEGPRCRSYWSACLCLADADPIVYLRRR